MNEVIEELARNITGYFLCILGLVLVLVGTLRNLPTLTETARSLFAAALLSFQTKQAPAGDTKTLQITTPPPANKPPST
jgi:hypothetical protein